MEFKGTKGEWKLSKRRLDYRYLSGEGWEDFARVCVMVDGSGNDEGKANAKLIASAPELLKELQKIKLDIDLGIIDVRQSSPIYEGIVRAINKALN